MDPQTPSKSTPVRPALQDILLRGLRIAASTVAIVELLRSHWTGGVLASMACLLFTQWRDHAALPMNTPATNPAEKS